MFRERERLAGHHAATGVLHFFEAIENYTSKSNINTLKIHWKYVHNLEQHEIELRS